MFLVFLEGISHCDEFGEFQLCLPFGKAEIDAFEPDFPESVVESVAMFLKGALPSNESLLKKCDDL